MYSSELAKKLYDEKSKWWYWDTEIRYGLMEQEPTITMYEKGDLSVETAIVQLKSHVTFDQLSFYPNKALECLQFISSEEV